MHRFIASLTLVILGGAVIAPSIRAQRSFDYVVDLKDTSDDLFHVTLTPPPLTTADSTYSFTAFAPGVHQVLDFGRFVKRFQAFDADGNEITTARRALNDWWIADPTRVAEIRYDMEDSFDADVETHVIFAMSGTGIEPRFVAINTHGLFGYFVSHRDDPTSVALVYPEGWVVGTALDSDDTGRYAADSYYRLADSPILLGDLSSASRRLGDMNVEAYVYSPDPSISADTVLAVAGDILQAAYQFIDYAPVDRYTFLMYFSDEDARRRNAAFRGGGALEHSYSSTYALPANPQMLHFLADIIAHEFLHILTPLNLRSEIIANWDYSRPTGEDRHLWLYEGVTEWEAHIIQLRAGMIDVEEYLRRMSGKINNTESFDSDWSLTRLSTEWFTDEGRTKYGDIYQLGALTAMCLDVRLLELSEGRTGLREVLFGMMKRYGKDRPFENAGFFDELVGATYPEIDSFIENFIRRRRPIDYGECLRPVGVRYVLQRPSADPTPQFGLRLTSTSGGRLAISGFSPEHEPFGLAEGDVIIKVFGDELTVQNSDSVMARKQEMKAGDEYPITVLRDGKTVDFVGRLVPRHDRNILELDPTASPEQERLRDIWRTNYHN